MLGPDSYVFPLALLPCLALVGCEASLDTETSGAPGKSCSELLADEPRDGTPCKTEGETCEGVAGTGGPISVDVYSCGYVGQDLLWSRSPRKTYCLWLDPECTEQCCNEGERCETEDALTRSCVGGVWTDGAP